MLNCVPIEVAATSNYFLSRSSDELFSWLIDLRKKDINHVYVHMPSLTECLNDAMLHTDSRARSIIELWENNILIPIPNADKKAELPAIVSLNTTIHPDNVRVYCGNFIEYIALRKYFGKEDVKY